MENNNHGLLYNAAGAWKELTEYYFFNCIVQSLGKAK